MHLATDGCAYRHTSLGCAYRQITNIRDISHPLVARCHPEGVKTFLALPAQSAYLALNRHRVAPLAPDPVYMTLALVLNSTNTLYSLRRRSPPDMAAVNPETTRREARRVVGQLI